MITGDSDKGAGMHAFGNVRVHTARHRMQDLWLCFQFAAL
jgi:hypothetical protein